VGLLTGPVSGIRLGRVEGRRKSPRIDFLAIFTIQSETWFHGADCRDDLC
jgi:hypothetical protein